MVQITPLKLITLKQRISLVHANFTTESELFYWLGLPLQRTVSLSFLRREKGKTNRPENAGHPAF